MATSDASPTRPFRMPTATSFGASKLNSKSDWLGPALLAAKTISEAAEGVPFPYVKGAFGVIVVLLETIEKAKKNRDDLKELCENSMEIMKIVQDQISSHGPTAAEKLKSICEELESALKVIVDEVTKWQEAPRGFRSRVKEMVKSSSITDQIGEYQNKVRTLCSNLKVNKIHATLTTIAPNLSIAQAPQSINNCLPPSRIFHGRQDILAKMHQYFTEDWGKQHIYVLYGLGGSGKTQIALKFIDESASKYSDIFLIDASTPETIDTGLKRIAATKKIGDTAQDALDWLHSKQNEWLLFFDNADDPKLICTVSSLTASMGTSSSHLEILNSEVMGHIPLFLIWRKLRPWSYYSEVLPKTPPQKTKPLPLKLSRHCGICPLQLSKLGHSS
ncbi:hypothetical protein FB451DRAFT_1369177 [Mycena latifolia]|nr:hypothetical protein FB451DRAFT_1369177 [Mycena latifolia]